MEGSNGSAEGVGLKKSMGWVTLFAMAAATVIGPWLVMTNWWISLTGASIALAFVVVGLLCIPIGMVYGELTGMFPKTGGSFVYIQKAFGREASFWANWSLMLSYTAVLAFQLMALMTIIQYLWWPGLTIEGMMLISGVIATALFVMNTRQVNLSAGVQFVLFLVLAVVGFGYVIMFFLSPQFSTANWEPFFQSGTNGFLTATALMVTMLFGFEVIPQFAEEAKYPVHKHWKLMVGAIIFATAFYGVICLAEAGMAPYDVAINTPLLGAELGLHAYGTWLQYLIALANVAALATCLIGFWMGGSRVLLAMGRARALPKTFASINKNNVPKTGNVVIFVITLMFILLSGTAWLASLFTLMAIGVGITYTGVALAYVKFKLKSKTLDRPWKAPGGIVTGVIAVLAGLVITYFTVIYFTTEVWILFLAYFGIVAVIRVLMKAEESRHPEEYVLPVEGPETEPQ